ncbi:MAG TPA: tRNA pseudouridine(38-40) synthase TruA [Pirellulales bacterium]|jgi:tRNA pseudouridine38-40 synthase|nr:tRNA pseudouridine(38-40) synthase TruA [Pirellulales bacterium]
MRTLKLTIAYDGTDFLGWQFQPGRRTVQQTLQDVLGKITGETISVVASGRTDSGVHALGQAVSFETGSRLSDDVLARALNAELPDDMAVIAVERAPYDFHVIRDAARKRYRYVLQDGLVADVFSRRYAWHVFRPLDAGVMHRAAQALVGRHDFSSFETSGSERTTTVRTVFELTVARQAIQSGWRGGAGADEIHIEVAADGFLYNMVRNIVGTLVEVGRGVRDETWPAAVLAARDRRAAGPTAPPQGLFLVSVEFEGRGARDEGKGEVAIEP